MALVASLLRNRLRATAARTFSTSQIPKMVRQWCASCILTSTCALRYNGVHFFRHLNFQKCSDAEKRSQCIAHAHQHSVSRLFYLFSTFLRTSIFFALFSSLTLSTSAFPSVHIVRSLTSKLPSILYDSVHILNVKSTRANLKHSKSSKALK